MELEQSAKFIKHLLILQILVLMGIAICEVVQLAELAEINKSQQPITQHLDDWIYLIGYTKNIWAIITRIYYWIIIFISFGAIGWSLNSFSSRWKDLQNYSDNPRNITLLVLWCIATIPNVIFLASNGMRACSASSYSYYIPPKLLRQCNAYLASLLLAYVFILTVIIQLLFHFVIINHLKLRNKRLSSIKPPPNLQVPKKLKVRRSKRVSKKRHSLRSNSAFSNGTRLSIVTEDDEEKSTSSKSNKSARSYKSARTSIKTDAQSEFTSEMQVNSNV